jgi:hypothetical protein
MRPNRTTPTGGGSPRRGLGRRRPVRRGRRLDARRTSAAPEAPSSAALPSEEAEPAAEAVGARSKHSRPPAPSFELGRALLDEEAPDEQAPDEQALDEQALDEQAPDEQALDGASADDDQRFEEQLDERAQDLAAEEALESIGAESIGTEMALALEDDEEKAPDTPRDAGWLRNSSPPSTDLLARAGSPIEERADEASDEDGDADDDASERDAREHPASEQLASDEELDDDSAPSERVIEIPSLRKLSLEDAARLEQESFPPVVEELDGEEREPEVVLSQEQLRRRGSLRRLVAAAVVVVGALSVGLAAKATISPDPLYAQRQGVAAVARLGPDAAAAARAKRAEVPPAQVEEPSEAAPAIDGSYEELSRRVVGLLNERKFEEAIPVGERLIELEPASAFGYRCLGSALQDLGRTKEARAIYSACASSANKGEVFECSALGGVANKK